MRPSTQVMCAFGEETASVLFRNDIEILTSGAAAIIELKERHEHEAAHGIY